MKNKPVPYSTIAAFLHGEATADQISRLEEWLGADESHRELFAGLRKEWEAAHPWGVDCVVPDKELVWTAVRARIRRLPGRLYTRSFVAKIAGAAAGIALMAGAGAYYLWDRTSLGVYTDNRTVLAVPAGSQTEVILPDGTSVRLNSGSVLAYEGDFNRKRRHVTLEGEAFFHVTGDIGKEFIVSTGLVDVRVLGTRFNVSAYADDDFVSVALVEGSVELNRPDGGGQLAELLAGEVATVTRDELSCSIALAVPGVDNAWLDNRVVLRDASHEELFKQLERRYGVRVRVETDRVPYRYWFTIRNESLNEVLQLIDKTTPIEYEINGKEVVIRYME
ncbi:MAG: FecR domain-containing protein [Alistipes sp.]|nr:FecR domain-containing protein [Alistipes sp.]